LFKWKTAYSVLLFFLGCGLFLHDRWVEASLGHLHPGIHGLDWGFILMLIGFITLGIKYKILVKRR